MRLIKKQNYLVNVITEQNSILFFKKKFGLFKTRSFKDRRNKQKLFFILNFIRNKKLFSLKRKHKRNKILYYKKFNKLFFRAGRKILMNF